MLKDVLRALRTNAGKTQDEVALYLNLQRPSYTRYESGTSKPDSDTLILLADYYNVSVDFLLDREKNSVSIDERRLLQVYRKSSNYAKKVAIFVLENSYGSDQADTIIELPLHSIDYYADYPVSAGLGNFLDETHKETLQLKKKPPQGASFVNRITGDSMEPDYREDDRVFVSVNPPSPGQIGICLYENEVYMKKIGDHELVSLNTKYPPIKITNLESFFCIGTVLGKVNEEDVISG